ncbi:facilitated trehalose transporter Tret1-like [Diabrotica undecimpunctata]|uniref:facilitated trehalose transporter Tret1-like n=1 Tax=Diabrotica undecimpunctata TaxID=50387 RepID=UPI003B63BCA1
MSDDCDKTQQYIAAVCICIGAFGIGTGIGWTSNITQDLKEGELNEIDMTDVELGWMGAMLTLGAIFMCIAVGWIVDMIGRKATVLFSIFPFLIGWVLITCSAEITLTYIGRFLVGIAGGSFCVIVPLYTSEIAHDSIRGALGTFFQLSITIGIFYCGVFGFVLPLIAFNITCCAIPLLFGVAFFFQPETPTFMLKQGHVEKAENTFRRLRGESYDFSAEMKQILSDIEREHYFLKAFEKKSTKRALLICFMLMFYQQLSGINAIMFYSQEIFYISGSQMRDSYCVILLQFIQVIATLLSTITVDWFGRRILLLASSGCMSFSTAFIGLYFSLKQNGVLGERTGFSFIPIMSLNIFIIAYSFGFGPIPWMIPSEMFTPEIKTKCSAMAATFNWTLAFLVTKFYFPLSESIGVDSSFYIFSFISATAILFVYFIIPETRGKTFAQIQIELEK